MVTKLLEVHDFNGEHLVNSKEELKDLMLQTAYENSNCFYIVSKDTEYPLLNILTKGNIAVAHYFEVEGHPGYISMANTNSNDEMFLFYQDSTGESVEISQINIISIEDAVNSSIEFFYNRKKPETIAWFEL